MLAPLNIACNGHQIVELSDAVNTDFREVIGGIDEINAGELAPVGRAAVSTAILAAPDPGRAARALRSLLEREDRPFSPRG